MASASPLAPRLRRFERVLWSFLFVGLVVYAALTFWLALRAFAYPYQLDNGEGNILWFTRQFAYGQTVYKDLFSFPYVTNNYPPVPMLLTAPWVRLLGPTYTPGRILNFGAVLVIAVLLYVLAYRETSERRAGVLAALGFFGSTFVYHWAGLYRSDLLGLAFSLAGIYVLKRQVQPGIGAQGFSLACFLLALYTKQSYLAAPAAATLYLFLQDRRKGLIYAAVFGTAAGLVMLVGQWATGGAFWTALITLNASAWLWNTFVQLAGMWVRSYGVLIFLAVILWAVRVGRDRRMGLHELYFGLASLTVLLSGRVGAWENYYFEIIALVCLFASCWFVNDTRRVAQPGAEGTMIRRVPTALVLAAWLLQLALFLPDHDPHIAANLFETEGPANAALQQLLAATDGPVVSEDLGALVTANKPVVYYSFIYSNLARTGQWDQQWELENLRSRTFPLIVLERGTREDADHFRRFTHEFLSALDGNYRVAQDIGKFEVYRPAPLKTVAPVSFEGKLAWIGISTLPAALDTQARELMLALLWRAETNLSERYTAFVHLEDRNGGIVAQDDHEPRGGRFPTTLWKQGDEVRDDYRLVWKQPLAPGTYSLRVGWYDSSTQERLSAGAEDVVTVAEVQVNSR